MAGRMQLSVPVGLLLGLLMTSVSVSVAQIPALLGKWNSGSSGAFTTPCAVAVAPDGHVYVADTWQHRVQKFNSAGVPEAPWASAETFAYTIGVAVDGDGNVFVADYGYSVVRKYTSTGAPVTVFGGPGTGSGKFTNTGGVAVAPDGSVYVLDLGGNRIEKFTNSGAFVLAWGTLGSGDGEFAFQWPSGGVAVDASGNVYVADTGNNRIQKFTAQGGFLMKWGTAGSQPGQFSSPRGVATDASGLVYVAEEGNSRVQVFSSAGTYLYGWGVSGTGDGEFAGPRGLAVDSNFRVYVADTGNNRVEVFAGAGGPPGVFSFAPIGGPVGTEVDIRGFLLADALNVSFNGVPAAVLESSDTLIRVIVPPGATSGPISVTTSLGTTVTSTPFFVGEAPRVDLIQPDSARVGEPVVLTGANFTHVTTVRFGGTGEATFVVDSDTQITAMPDSFASSGHVSVQGPTGSDESSQMFLVLSDDPRPHLLSVRDVPGDQGGYVVVKWRASDFDQPRYKTILRYRVWRRAGLDASVAGASKSGTQVGRFAYWSPGGAGPLEFWENIAELPAAFLKGYAYTAATVSDSTELGNPYTAFFVQAVTGDPFVFFNSSPDSGFSVDNLAPPTPSAFAVRYGVGSNSLHWTASAVADLKGYAVYRGATASFVPGPQNLVAVVKDSVYLDEGGADYYKLSALDIHGNRSRYLLVTPDRPVATLISLVSAYRSAGRTRVTWYSPSNGGLIANVYRSESPDEWSKLGVVTSDGQGYLNFEDPNALDDHGYGYRLGIEEPGLGESFLGEAWLPAMTTAGLGMAPVRNPSVDGRISVSLSLPATQRAELTLYDVSGREVERAEVSAQAGGATVVEFGASVRLPAGLYLVRAVGGGVRTAQRVVVLR